MLIYNSKLSILIQWIRVILSGDKSDLVNTKERNNIQSMILENQKIYIYTKM